MYKTRFREYLYNYERCALEILTGDISNIRLHAI